MVKSVSPELLKLALDSWEVLKQKDDYEKVAGGKVMKFLFQKCPKAMPMFGYDIETDVEGEFLADPKFVAHSVQLIGMFDTAFAMLGPDGLLLAEKIGELGEKHVKYGVRAEMFPIMGKGLNAMLEEELGDAFTDELRKAWRTVFGAISEELMKTVLRAGRAERGELASDSRGAVAA